MITRFRMNNIYTIMYIGSRTMSRSSGRSRTAHRQDGKIPTMSSFYSVSSKKYYNKRKSTGYGSKGPSTSTSTEHNVYWISK